MARIESIQFACECGKRLGARADQAGRRYACPGCGRPVQVPAITVEDAAPARATDATPARADRASGGLIGVAPKSVSELLLFVLGGWSIVAFVGLVLMFFGSVAFYVGLTIVAIGSVAALFQAAQLAGARRAVLARGDVALLFGWARLIAWEPTQGVLILRDKAVHFADDDLDDGKGGVRLLYPLFGEELALRVPLEVQSLAFTADNVLTREYLGLTIRGTLKWRIVDISRFYLQMSRELRTETSGSAFDGRHGTSLPAVDRRPMDARLIEASIDALRGLAEEQTRSVVSRVRSGLLLAERVTSDVPELRELVDAGARPSAEAASEGLASAVHATLSDRLRDYGLAVIEVSLQEVGLPPAIVAQCAEACRTAYLPLMAERRAAARHAQLRAEVDVLGVDIVGAREVVRQAPAYALGEFLTKFLAARAPAAASGDADTAMPAIDLAALAAAAETSGVAATAPRQIEA